MPLLINIRIQFSLQPAELGIAEGECSDPLVKIFDLILVHPRLVEQIFVLPHNPRIFAGTADGAVAAAVVAAAVVAAAAAPAVAVTLAPISPAPTLAATLRRSAFRRHLKVQKKLKVSGIFAAANGASF